MTSSETWSFSVSFGKIRHLAMRSLVTTTRYKSRAYGLLPLKQICMWVYTCRKAETIPCGVQGNLRHCLVRILISQLASLMPCQGPLSRRNPTIYLDLIIPDKQRGLHILTAKPLYVGLQREWMSPIWAWDSTTIPMVWGWLRKGACSREMERMGICK